LVTGLYSTLPAAAAAAATGLGRSAPRTQPLLL